MRPALLTLVLLSACGRSSLTTHAEAGASTAPASHPADLEAGATRIRDAAADPTGRETEDSSRCSYRTNDSYVVSCGGDFGFVNEMVDGREDCPRRFVFERTGRAYPLLSDLLSENACDSLCRWESGMWVIRNCGEETSYVTSYNDLLRRCPPFTLWYSSATGTFYESREEATATLPSCPDG